MNLDTFIGYLIATTICALLCWLYTRAARREAAAEVARYRELSARVDESFAGITELQALLNAERRQMAAEHQALDQRAALIELRERSLDDREARLTGAAP